MGSTRFAKFFFGFAPVLVFYLQNVDGGGPNFAFSTNFPANLFGCHRVMLQTSIHAISHTDHRDEMAYNDDVINLAAEALVKVFYGEGYQPQSPQLMKPEKALRWALKQYQNNIPHQCILPTVYERYQSRKMLAELVLGTSIMRMRHYCILRIEENLYHDLKGIEIILSLEKYMVQKNHYNQTNNGTTIDEKAPSKIDTVKRMINLHIEYIIDSKAHDFIFNEQHTQFSSHIDLVSIMYSLPVFIVKVLSDQYGLETTKELANVFNKPGPITIRRNKIKCASDSKLCERLWKDNSIETTPMKLLDLGLGSTLEAPEGCIRLLVNDSWSPSKESIWSMQTWRDGWFEVQDAGSQFIVKSAQLTKDDNIVVDYCAGNGGKTLAIASQLFGIINNLSKAEIVAHDIVDERLRHLRGSCSRAGLSDHEVSNIQIKTCGCDEIKDYRQRADVVLVDAPCSSIGVLRRRPSHRFILEEHQLKHDFPAQQLNILTEASKLVNPNGGRLIYATCSISSLENEMVVQAFESKSTFKNEWKSWEFESSNTLFNHCRQIIPTADGCDGFFIARWKHV